MSTKEAQRRSSAKYDKANTVMITLKLNLKTDSDIIELLESVGNKQGFIKSVLRERLLVDKAVEMNGLNDLDH